MSNYQELLIRLEKLKEYLKILNSCKKYSLDDFKNNHFLKTSLERYLQLAAQACIDIGEIIISEQKLKNAMFNSEIFEILGQEKIISKKLAINFIKIAKFRNVLVHDYVKVDLNKIYDYLQNDLNDFKDFIKQIAKFIKKEFGN